MISPRKPTIAAVVLLVCGVIVALVVRRLSPRLRLTLDGYQTNEQGTVFARIIVRNTSSRQPSLRLQILPPLLSMSHTARRQLVKPIMDSMHSNRMKAAKCLWRSFLRTLR